MKNELLETVLLLRVDAVMVHGYVLSEYLVIQFLVLYNFNEFI